MPGLFASQQFVEPATFVFMDGTDYIQEVVSQRAEDRHVVARPREELTYESTLSARKVVSREAYGESLQHLKETEKWDGQGPWILPTTAVL